MADLAPYQYSGSKRPRQELPAADHLATPVAFTAAKPKPRMALLPVIKYKATNPSRVATVAADKQAVASSSSDVVPVPLVRPPLVRNLDDYLTLVGNIHYQQAETSRTTAQWSIIRRTTLGTLTSPVREPSVLDKWSPYEIALFESAICLVGKMFAQVAAAVRSKSAQECIEFYYVWKMSSHYPLWKAAYKQTYGDVEDLL